MGFTNKKGKKLSENDIKSLKQIYTDLFEGYLKVMVEPDPIRFGQKYDDPAVEYFQNLCDGFLNKFDESSKNTEKDFVIEDFYNTEMNALFDTYVDYGRDPEHIQNGYFRQFYKRFNEHFTSRSTGSMLRNTDQGLAMSMEDFRLTKVPFEDIDKIADYDPNMQKEDPFIEARLSNSGTYFGLQLDENKELLNKSISDFRNLSEYTRNVAASLQQKETIEFSDLYNTISHLNKELRPEESDGGKVRVTEIAFGKGEGIDSCAIPSDLYTTLNQVADYMNEIKRTEDPFVRKSQAAQLAAFSYQLMISEHVFGNGNGRSCRLLSDTILQTFGLPPQVPTFDLINTAVGIGEKFDFEKGTKCFLRGLALATDLKNLNENRTLDNQQPEAAANIRKAQAYLNSENLSNNLLKVTSPANAINLAIQSGEARYSLVENLKDFISADHFGSWNSKQYKDLIATAQKTVNTLTLNSVYSKKSEKALEDLSTAIGNYEAHCQRHPKNNDTRRSRLNAVEHMKKSIAYAKDVSGMISTIEGIDFKKTLKANNEIISNYLNDDKLNEVKNGAGVASENRKLVGQYVLRKLVEKQVSEAARKINFEAAKEYAEDEKQLGYVLEGNTIEEAIKAASGKESFSGKTMEEKLDLISEEFTKIKVKELAEQPKPNQENLRKDNKQKNAAPDPEEKNILTYMK